MGATSIKLRLGAAVFLWLSLSVGLRGELESAMLSHALVLLPGLVIAGFMLVPRVALPNPEPFAVPVLLVAIFAGGIWMLPRMLDASLADSSFELAKLLTLPLLVGVPLGWSWPRVPGLVRAFVWSNLVSMLLILGWLYRAAPVRVCNYYLLHEQETLGNAYLMLAAAVTIAWIPRVFFGPARR